MTTPSLTLSVPSRRSFGATSRRAAVWAGALLLTAGLAIGCGGSDADSSTTGGEDAAASSAGNSPSKASSSGTSSSGVQAAKAAGPLETKYFKTVIPEGWEVLADDIDNMGLMTLSKKGTGGSQSVYFKFEGGGTYSGDPMTSVTKVAERYEGSPAGTVTLNGIPWARTAYTYNSIRQTMMITNANGYKFTFTIMGDDYDQSPGVKAVLDNLELS